MAAREEKAAVVEEVRAKLEDSDAVILTEYRGLTVAAISALRRSLDPVGGEYRVYKNTLVRRAVDGLGLELDDLLVGPTALAFVRKPQDGGTADPVAVAKALRTFAQTNDNLVLKGGLLGTRVLTAADVDALAKVAPREELLARLAGALAAPMQQFAGLLQALPQRFAYALQALIDAGGAAGAPGPAAEAAGPEGEAAGSPAEAAETQTEEAPETPGQDEQPEE